VNNNSQQQLTETDALSVRYYNKGAIASL